MEGDITPFLLEKWTQGFHFLDVNKDGEVTSDDYLTLADYVSSKTGASEEKAAKSRQEWVKWSNLITAGPSGKSDYQAFMNTCKRLFANRSHHIELNKATASDLFDLMDMDKDGNISMEELSIFYEAVGITDKTKIKTAFEHLDKDGDGFIQRKELIDDVVRQFTDPDPVTGQTYLMSIISTK